MVCLFREFGRIKLGLLLFCSLSNAETLDRGVPDQNPTCENFFKIDGSDDRSIARMLCFTDNHYKATKWAADLAKRKSLDPLLGPALIWVMNHNHSGYTRGYSAQVIGSLGVCSYMDALFFGIEEAVQFEEEERHGEYVEDMVVAIRDTIKKSPDCRVEGRYLEELRPVLEGRVRDPWAYLKYVGEFFRLHRGEGVEKRVQELLSLPEKFNKAAVDQAILYYTEVKNEKSVPLLLDLLDLSYDDTNLRPLARMSKWHRQEDLSNALGFQRDLRATLPLHDLAQSCQERRRKKTLINPNAIAYVGCKAAIRALAQIGAERSVEYLHNLAYRPETPAGIIDQILISLGDFGTERAALALRDHFGPGRYGAVPSLLKIARQIDLRGKIDGAPFREFLKKECADPGCIVRYLYSTIDLLVALHDTDSLPVLEEGCSQSTERTVRDYARKKAKELRFRNAEEIGIKYYLDLIRLRNGSARENQIYLTRLARTIPFNQEQKDRLITVLREEADGPFHKRDEDLIKELRETILILENQ